ncbi:MAG: hypothetical protein HIU81_11260 [Acidobacteria bacterium]|nr:hypothetical protein [Acidobacteriota bacterium]
MHEKQHIALDFLGYLRDKRGHQPGGFTTGLFDLWGKADSYNKARLAMAFPVHAAVINLYNAEGIEAVAKLAGVA